MKWTEEERAWLQAGLLIAATLLGMAASDRPSWRHPWKRLDHYLLSGLSRLVVAADRKLGSCHEEAI